MFIITSAFERATEENPKLPIEERMVVAMRQVGSSITLTFLANTIAFALGGAFSAVLANTHIHAQLSVTRAFCVCSHDNNTGGEFVLPASFPFGAVQLRPANYQLCRLGSNGCTPHRGELACHILLVLSLS